MIAASNAISPAMMVCQWSKNCATGQCYMPALKRPRSRHAPVDRPHCRGRPVTNAGPPATRGGAPASTNADQACTTALPTRMPKPAWPVRNAPPCVSHPRPSDAAHAVDCELACAEPPHGHARPCSTAASGPLGGKGARALRHLHLAQRRPDASASVDFSSSRRGVPSGRAGVRRGNWLIEGWGLRRWKARRDCRTDPSCFGGRVQSGLYIHFVYVLAVRSGIFLTTASGQTISYQRPPPASRALASRMGRRRFSPSAKPRTIQARK